MFKLNKKKLWLPILILIGLGILIYAFNLHNGLFWDDDDWIVNNIFVHDLSWSNLKFWFSHNTLAGVGLKSNYYRPFLFFTFALNYAIAGLKPLVYHLTSNAIHIFNTILVFGLIRQIFSSRFDLACPSEASTERRWGSSKRSNLMAFLTALFFLVHPLQTEAVTYISGRGDMLVAMFMLLALVLFYRSETRGNNWRGWAKVLSITFLALGLLSRETGIVFPFLALVFYMAVLFPRFDLENPKGRTFLNSLKQGLLKTWPYFAVVSIYGLLRLTALNFLNTLNFYTEPNLYSENLHVRLFTFLPILWEYLKLLVVPVGLHMERGATVYISFWQWPVWFIGLGSGALLFWLIYLYRLYRKIHIKSLTFYVDNFRVWFLGVLWFFITLAPVSGITPINALLYEHWLYLPMVGFWLIVSFYLVKLWDFQDSTFFKSQSKSLYFGGRTLMAIMLITYLSFLGYQSIQRNILWGKPIEFYQDILKHEPQSARISNNLGNMYFNQGDKEQAEKYYRQSVEAGDAFAQPYYNLGSILQSRGDIFGAIQLYEQAIQINPNFYYPYQNLAVIYAQQGKLTKAKENIEVLKSLLPNNPRVFYNSALIHLSLNDRAQALADLKTGLKYSHLDPETGELMVKLIGELESKK